MAKLIAVFGATGAQGGALVRALVKDDNFQVRAVVRSSNDSSKKLEELGCELVVAELDDKEAVKQALTGAYGCFLVTSTDFNQDNYYEREVTQGKCVADACLEAGVEHAIFSTIIPEMYKHFGISCAELDTKVEIMDYFKEKGIPVSGVMLSFYYENIMTVFKPKKIQDNVYGFGVPLGDASWALTSVEDMGEIVHQMYVKKDEYLGKTVQVVTEKKTLQEMCDTLNEKLKPLVFKNLNVSIDQFKQMPIPHINEISKLFELTMKAQDLKPDIETGAKLNPSRKSFEEWVTTNAETIKKAIES